MNPCPLFSPTELNSFSNDDRRHFFEHRIVTLFNKGSFASVAGELNDKLKADPAASFSFDVKKMLARSLLEIDRVGLAAEHYPITELIEDWELLPRKKLTGRALLAALDRNDSRSEHEIQQSIPESAEQQDSINVAYSLRSLALKKVELGQYETAVELLGKAREIAGRRCSPKDRFFLDVILDEIVLFLHQDQRYQLRPSLPNFIEKVRLRYGPDSLSTGDYCYYAGIIARSGGEPELAVVYLDAALSIYRNRWHGSSRRTWELILERVESTVNSSDRVDFVNLVIAQHFSNGIADWRLSVLLSAQGESQLDLMQYQEASKALLKSWELAKPILGTKHEFCRRLATMIADTFGAIGDPQQAEIWRTRAKP